MAGGTQQEIRDRAQAALSDAQNRLRAAGNAQHGTAAARPFQDGSAQRDVDNAQRTLDRAQAVLDRELRR